MKDLLSTRSSVLDGDVIGTLSQQIGATPSQTRGAAIAALPLLMGMMASNCQSEQGCESLAKAVENGHSGGLLNQALSSQARQYLGRRGHSWQHLRRPFIQFKIPLLT